jgi:hypothetical protein
MKAIKQDDMVLSSTRPQFLWNEMEFEIHIQASFNE